MALRYCIRFSGAGGQGLILAARILAEAAAIYDNMNAAESCSYGPEARGAASRAEIIISDEAIDHPRAEKIDMLMVLTQEAFDKNIDDVVENGVVVADSRIETGGRTSQLKLYAVPFTDIADQECSRPGMVNIVVLGFFAAVNDVVNRKSIRQAILARVPKMSEQLYICAYEAGLKAAEAMRVG